VVAGLLPDADTWPQEAKRTSHEIQADSEVTFSPEIAGRLGANPYWDQSLFLLDRKKDLGNWLLHVEEPEHWGLALESDLYANKAERTWRSTNLIVPEAETGNIFPAERHFVTAGWLWYDFHPLQVELGRDRLHWGPLDHSLIVSDSLPFFDMVRASLEVPHWSLEWVVATPETRTGGTSTDVTVMKVMNLHRIEYKADTWRLAFSENYIVARSGPIVWADLFPVMVEHQADINPNNEIIYAEGEWVPAPHWRLMAQFGLDDVEAKTFGMPDDDTPTIPSFQLGGEYRGTWGRGDLALHVEGGHTHYLWGNFQTPEARAEYVLVQNDQADVVPLTSPYGPGATWVDAWARWSRGPLTAQARLEVFSIHPGVTLDIPYRTNTSLDGIGMDFNDRLSVTLSVKISPSWTVTIEPSRSFNNGKATLECHIGVSTHWSTQGPGSGKLAS
jgi:hypothetical protein